MNKEALIKRFNIAVELEKKGEYLTALNEYLSILREDRKYRDVYINLGSLYSRMNRLDESLKYFEKAVSLEKDYIVYFNIGCVFYKLGEYKKAVINLEKSRNINKGFIPSTLIMGLSYSRLKNIKAAEINFQKVLKSEPDNRVATTALAIIYHNQRKFRESISLLDHILSKESGNIKIQELKSNILLKAGKMKESAEEFKKLSKISDGYKFFDEFVKSVPVEAYNDKYGTIDEKIENLQNMDSIDGESMISLSLCHLLKGDTDKAIDLLFRAKKKNNTIN